MGETRENVRSFGTDMGAVYVALCCQARAIMDGTREKARILCDRVHGQRYRRTASKSVEKTRKMEGQKSRSAYVFGQTCRQLRFPDDGGAENDAF